MFLRVWIQKVFHNFELDAEAVPIFIDKLSALLKEYSSLKIPQASRKQLEDLSVILNAHAKSIKVYSLPKYSCFKEVISILNYFSNRLAKEDLSQLPLEALGEMSHYILILCRVIFRAIKIEKSENPSLLLEANGIEAIFSILRNMLRKISVTNQPEPEDYYTDLSLSYHDLKIINIIALIIRRVFICYPSQLIVLDIEKKLQLFLNFQTISKIPLILFELIKTQSEKSLEKSTTEKTETTSVGDAPENSMRDEGEPYDSDTAPIFDVIISEPQSSNAEKYIFKIFIFVKNLIDLFTELSLKVDFASFFVQSGLSWRCLEFLTYYGDITPQAEKVHKVNYQSMQVNIEKLCNIFRNNLIFSNEAYIWKLTGGLVSRGIGIITSREKSTKLVQALNKIDNNEKKTLATFHECVINLLGKHILQVLLMDYYEPTFAPEGKERNNIVDFVKIFSTSLHDPATLWNSETRQELKTLLINQLFEINSTQGK